MCEVKAWPVGVRRGVQEARGVKWSMAVQKNGGGGGAVYTVL